MANGNENINGAKWINYLLPRRRESRGDLVGGIALWAFGALLVCLVFGGSHLALGGTSEAPKFLLTIPKIDWALLVGLLTPIVSHVIKGSIEVKGKPKP